MRIILCDNYEELSKKAAKLVASQITLKPDSVLGLATGSTPVGMYGKLADMCNSGELDFSEVKTFNLDEYYPIKKTNNQSYDYFMRENLFSKINIRDENIHIPNGEADDPEKECADYEKKIRESGGIDLQVLGIGRNGHIGFNEPDASLNSFTHLTKLTENTIKANSRFFRSADEVPRQALTMGIATILNAKKIVLLASGANKRKVVSELIGGGINTSVPATMLKTHPDVVLICDRESYSGARLGIDIGGTNIKTAIIDSDNTVVYKGEFKTGNTENEIITGIVETVAALRGSFDITTVGIGTPGIIKDGKVTAANLPFKGTPLESLIEEKTGLSVTVDNDANCAALGEVVFGNTKDCENIVLITLGTGVGGGIIMNRQILRSNNNMGEIGHFVIRAKNGRPCKCGQSGCWEQYCSMTAFTRDAKAMAKKNPDSILFGLMKDGTLTGEDIFNAMDSGCEVAKKVFDDYIRYLAIGINSLVNIFGPDAIVLAGGVTRQGEKLLEPLRQLIKSDVRIEISNLQNDAGALGAAML